MAVERLLTKALDAEERKEDNEKKNLASKQDARFFVLFVYSEEIPHKSWKKSLTRNRDLKPKSHRKVGRSRSVEMGLENKNPTQNFG